MSWTNTHPPNMSPWLWTWDNFATFLSPNGKFRFDRERKEWGHSIWFQVSRWMVCRDYVAGEPTYYATRHKTTDVAHWPRLMLINFPFRHSMSRVCLTIDDGPSRWKALLHTISRKSIIGRLFHIWVIEKATDKYGNWKWYLLTCRLSVHSFI